MANYYPYTNNSQGYNSMSNGTYQAYGSYQQQQGQTTATAYQLTSSQPQQVQAATQPQAAYHLSYAAAPQQSGTQQASSNVTNTQQQQSYSSYYSSSTIPTSTPQFSKPASYYHQQPNQQQSYYNAAATSSIVIKPDQQSQYATTIKTEPATAAQQYAAVNNSAYSAAASMTQQQHQPPLPPQQQQQATNKQQHQMTSTQQASTPICNDQYNMIKQYYAASSGQQQQYHQQTQQHQQQKVYANQRTNQQKSYNLQNLHNMPYWKQKRILNQQNRDPNKPIVASEVKAWLYAWLSRQKSKPEYTINNHSTRTCYIAELTAVGHQYVGKGCASNKKDSQTRAAWDFIDHLLQAGKMDSKNLPTREAKFEAVRNRIPANYKPIHYSQEEHDIRIAQQQKQFAIVKPAAASNKKKPAATTGGKKEPVVTSQTVKPLMSIDVKRPVPAAPKTPGPMIGPVRPPGWDKEAEASSAAKSASTSNATTTANIEGDSSMQAEAEGESTEGAVGEKYVKQTWTDGRVIRYRCELCQCEFNDPTAKVAHIKGRRHRLAYKQKVDPTISVEIKLNPKQKSMMLHRIQAEKRNREEFEKRREWRAQQQEMRAMEADMYYRRMQVPPLMGGGGYRRMGAIPPLMMRSLVNRSNAEHGQDENLILNKHHEIYPKEDELRNIQRLVQCAEQALKGVAEKIHEEEMMVFTANNLHSKQMKKMPENLLKSVLRTKSLAKGLLLHGDVECQLVLLCNERPTKGMLKRIATILPDQLKIKSKEMDESASEDDLQMEFLPEEEMIKVKSISSQMVANVYLTSPLIRREPKPQKPTPPAKDDGAVEPAAAVVEPISKLPPDMLNKEKAIKLLASLRHVKWFQAKASTLPSCVVVIRIMKDFCARIPTWRSLTSWTIEVIIQRVISNVVLYDGECSPYTALLMVFQTISGGLLLEDGPGLLDPCEREVNDMLDYLTLQQREDITASAQHALRQILFGELYQVLGVEKPEIAQPPPPDANQQQGEDTTTESTAEQPQVAVGAESLKRTQDDSNADDEVCAKKPKLE